MTTTTFEITTVLGVPAIHCLMCDRTSELPGDVKHRYCGRCHLFHDVVAEARAMVAAGGTHDCGEWRTWRGVCALCGREVDRNDPDAIDLARELRTHGPMELTLTPLSVFQMTGLVQLALRHPDVSQDIRATADRFLEGVREYFATCPAVLEIVRRGDYDGT